MNGLTRFFLVLLRLAIGWLFLFEGLEKIESIKTGPTETTRPFSSAGYLGEASGPLGDLIRRQIADLDEAALARLTPLPLHEGQDPARTPFRQRVPPPLEKDWDAYFQRFAAHYGLDDAQRKLAEAKLEQAKDKAVRWLLTGVKDVEKTVSTSTIKLQETTPQRIKEYEDKLREVQDIVEKRLPAFGHDVKKQELRTLKADATRLRTTLLDELNQPMKDALQSVLTDEQKKNGPVPEAEASHWWDKSRLQWIDAIIPWWLAIVGLCLLLGLFTRLACVGGALFLLLLYVAMPPLPWVPEATHVEGHYYVVSKNLIVLLALLALATTSSGRWVGLDGLVRILNPWRRRARPAA